jgi:magnesium-transporting ATPase (P-type)
VVGDVLLLQSGAVVPCDGVLLSGHGLVCKESKHEGVPLVKKATIEHLTKVLGWSNHRPNDYSCFMHSGDKVLEGSGRYIVTAVSVVGVIDSNYSVPRACAYMLWKSRSADFYLAYRRHTWWISSLLKASVIATGLLVMCLIRFASELQLNTTHR